MTHDYKRNGTATLFAALNVLEGTVTGKNMRRVGASSEELNSVTQLIVGVSPHGA